LGRRGDCAGSRAFESIKQDAASDSNQPGRADRKLLKKLVQPALGLPV
jgi:hypothetical protein